MFHELAELTIAEGREEEFEAAYQQQGRRILARAAGFMWTDLARSVERPSTYLLRVCWRTVENHTVDFREGPLFQQWREVVGPFFAEQPKVEHVQPRFQPFRG